MHEGKIVLSGVTADVTRYYLDHTNNMYSPITWTALPGNNATEVKLNSIRLLQNGASTSAINCREAFDIHIDYQINEVVRGSRFFLIFRNDRGEVIFTTSDYDMLSAEAMTRKTGRFLSRVAIPGGLLKTGGYYGSLGMDIKDDRVIFAADDAFHFDVFEPEDDVQAGRHKRPGAIAPLLSWEISELH